MNREQAEKLLAALIFDDLDEASKAELLAYLQRDDELRDRLADLRMAAKLTGDAVNDGPNPVLNERRLKQLKRLAKADKAKVRVFPMRLLAVAAVLMLAFLLVGTFMPRMVGRSPMASSTTSLLQSSDDGVAYYMGPSQAQSRDADSSSSSRSAPPAPHAPVATRPATRAAPSKSAGPTPRSYNTVAQPGRAGMGGMATDRQEGYAGGMGGMGGMASDRKDNRDPGIMAGGMGGAGGATRGRGSGDRALTAFATGLEDGSGVQAGKEVLNEQVAVSEERVLRELQERRASAIRGAPADTFATSLRAGSTSRGQELEVAKEAAGKPITTEPESRVRLGRELSSTDLAVISGIHQGPRQEAAAEAPARADGGANYDRKVAFGWTGEITPQKPAAPVSTPTPSASVATDAKKSDQVLNFRESGNRTPVLGDIPVSGQLFQKDVGLEAKSDGSGQSIGGAKGPADVSSVRVQDESAPLDARLADSLTKLKAEQNAPSPGAVRLNYKTPAEDTATLASSSHFKVVPVNPWILTDRDALSTFGLDVDTASYSLCGRYIRNGYLPPIGAVRMEEFIKAFDYAYPQRDDAAFAVHADGAPSPFAPAGQDLTLLKIAVKARTIGRDQRRAANLVFVVDASASMGQADRLPIVQSASNRLVDRLSEADRVSLITCAGDARLHLEAVSAGQKDTIHETINAIQPAGPTNLLAGLKLGYEMARKNFVAGQTNQVVLCSDGVANVGQTEAQAMLQEVAADRKQAITLTCVGVGYGAYNDAFLEALADQGDGRYVFLDSSEQAQEALVGQLAESLQNVARDARIQVQFNPNRVRRYRLIGYENRDIEDQRFRDDTVDAGAVGSGQCSTALYELELMAPSSGEGDADLGTVFVRYRNAETGQMEEVSRPLAGSLVRRRSVEEDPRFFLAAGAARFAEWLRQSEHAQRTVLPDVQRLLDQVSAALPLDRDVQDLAALTHQAEGLPRAPEAATVPETQP